MNEEIEKKDEREIKENKRKEKGWEEDRESEKWG